jgi:hypothetical protein
MNNCQLATATGPLSEIDSDICMPKEKWLNENTIQVIDPAPWLNKYSVGKEIHFHSGYSNHSFRIDISTARHLFSGYTYLNRIELNFRTIDSAKINHIILYDGRSIFWKQYNCRIQGDYAYSCGPRNRWNFEPPVKIENNLSLVLHVDFGAPVRYVPEFVFLEARILVSRSNSYINSLGY